MKMPVQTLKVSGEFRLIISGDKEREDVKSKAEFTNLITEGGLERFCGHSTGGTAAGSPAPLFSSLFGGFAVGAGNTPPQITDVGLESQIAYRGVSEASRTASWADGYFQMVGSTQYGQGEAAGNLSEIGIINGPGGTLWSRALIQDASGNPTTITVLPSDFLTVEYTIRFFYPTEDQAHEIVVLYDEEPVETTVSTRVGSANSDGSGRWSGTLRPSGNGRSSSTYPSNELLPEASNISPGGRSSEYPPYVPGSKEIWSQIFFNLDQANGDVGKITTGDLFGQWQYSFDPPIVKDNTQELIVELGIKIERA